MHFFVGRSWFFSLNPSSFNPIWNSHDFNGHGVRYKIWMGINNCTVVWAIGTCTYGLFWFKNCSRLKHELIFGERVIAERGYPGRLCTTPTYEPPLQFSTTADICARHETLNRLKSYNVLVHRLRHSYFCHTDRFYAVLNLVILSMKNGSPLFERY